MPHYKYRQFVGRNSFGMLVVAKHCLPSIPTYCITCHKRLQHNKTCFKACCPCTTTKRATYEWFLSLTRKKKLSVMTNCPDCDHVQEEEAAVIKGTMANPSVTYGDKTMTTTSFDISQWPDTIYSCRRCENCLLRHVLEHWQFLYHRQRCLPVVVIEKWKRFVAKKKKARLSMMLSRWRHKARNKRLLELDHENRRRTIDFCGRADKRNLVVCAPAGGGKTSLLLSCARESPDKNYLLLTFNKLLADEVADRAPPNLDVFTFDALCYNAIENPGAQSMTDRHLIKKAYPKCMPWYKKKGASGIAKLVMEHMRGSKIHLCPVHKQSKFALEKGLSVPSFFTNRYRVLKSKVDLSLLREKLVEGTGSWDVVLVDEFQDLTTEALDILSLISCPVVCVGDPNQNIYGFQNDSCRQCIVVPSQSSFLKGVERIQLYQTFRYGTNTIQHTNNYGSQMAASLKGTDCVMRITSFEMFRALLVPGTAVLCRSNKECFQVLEESEKPCEWFPDKLTMARIAGGAKVASELAELENMPGRTTRSPLQGWVYEMRSKGTLEDTIRTLRLKGDDNSATDIVISTVHRAKGMQFKRVIAINLSIIDEPEVSYVGHTRHTDSLVIFDCEALRNE